MPLRMAQYGTGHGHAAGKWRAMATNPDVEFVGIFEPDLDARARAQNEPAYAGARWYDSAEDILGDETIQAIAIEGRNDESLAMAHAALAADKHLWYDKPAGDDWPSFQALVAAARERRRLIQMGYMLRYHDAFRQVAEWARAGMLGHPFQVRAHMSTSIPVAGKNGRATIARHRGGILFDLGGHMLDQVVWILGRPKRVQSYLRNDATPELPQFADNTLAVIEYDRALATVHIAAMEPRPMARRFEVYGTRGTAILLEPFEPGGRIRLVLAEPSGDFGAGEQILQVAGPPRQELYERELAAFVRTTLGGTPPDRSLDHESLVQETLLRATGAIPGN